MTKKPYFWLFVAVVAAVAVACCVVLGASLYAYGFQNGQYTAESLIHTYGDCNVPNEEKAGYNTYGDTTRRCLADFAALSCGGEANLKGVWQEISNGTKTASYICKKPSGGPAYEFGSDTLGICRWT
jgi:hypothetical protein